MTAVNFLLERFSDFGDSIAVICQDRTCSYRELLSLFDKSLELLDKGGVPRGAIVTVEGDFSPTSIAMLLALIQRGCVVVPLTQSVAAKLPTFLEVAQVEYRIGIGDGVDVKSTGVSAEHPLLHKLKSEGHSGLVLFSSGSTGVSKGALHDFIPLLEKFKVIRHRQCAVSFLLFDHIGGLNTLLYSLSNGGCLVTLIDRSPDAVLSAVDKWGVELLPTSPTFLNLVLISEAYKRYSLRTLKTVTYGTEPMPESTLVQITKVLPHVQFLQTYGLSEIGILRSKSKSSDSLWVKIGGEGFQTRVVDGLLEVKAQSAMLGYLNAESPFTTDGWFKTGDMVEQDGDYFKILGRKSEIINVGGEKVYPAEVESVVLEVEGVEQVTVFGERNAITGQMVVARVKPASNIEPQGLTQSIRKHCQSKLARYKVPVKVLLSDEEHHTERFKRDRQRVGRAIE